ncbi:hypothetical protein [Streptomyces sp. NPDC046909]|uniref:hypothetical protein n=1 Tax=Streptomyces sp. NPDC046909 TaxID=3155617 RepID=UPI0033D51E06
MGGPVGTWHGSPFRTLLICGFVGLLVGDGKGDGDGTTWLEPVTDEQYVAALSSAGQ